jgi:predicted phosphodiesterase
LLLESIRIPIVRVHLFSDLHLEFGICEFSQQVRAGHLAELVLLPGDIDVKRRSATWAAETFSQPVALLGGNHESYGDSLYASIFAHRKSAEASSNGRQNAVRFLECETLEVKSSAGTPVRIIGATLWIDFEIFGTHDQRRMMIAAGAQLNDYRRIRIRDAMSGEMRPLDPMDTLRLHLNARAYLEMKLANGFDGITIVMTHHAPSLRSVPDQFANDPLTAAYASNLEPVIERFQPHLWVHGHLHNSSDYKIGLTRVVCNPRGYAPSELNPQFNPELVIELL